MGYWLPASRYHWQIPWVLVRWSALPSSTAASGIGLPLGVTTVRVTAHSLPCTTLKVASLGV